MKKYPFRPKFSFLTTVFLPVVLLSMIALMGISVVAAQEPIFTPTGPSKTGDSNPGLVAALAKSGAEISYHNDTGAARFISSTPGRPISQPAALQAGASKEDAARGFLSVYGPLFGIRNQSTELVRENEKKPDATRTFERFQQVYNGVPVIGGELIVQVDSSNNILSANGEVLPKIALSTTPVISASTAVQTALTAVAKGYDLKASDLKASTPVLSIYNPTLITPDTGISRLVWRMEVTPNVTAPIRELVLIDARQGSIALHFNQVDTVLDRKTYTANNTSTLPGTLICNESDPNCTGSVLSDADSKSAHIGAGATYNFYFNNFGRDSIDGAGMTLISTVHYRRNISVPYANAFWDGTQMVYGDAYTFAQADDVVAHELTHGVTEHESNLFYFFQSGAINESFSDVFGEFVDQTDSIGNDAPAVKWLMGEDVLPGGAIRSMSNPPAFGDPDRLTSPLYNVGPTDNGGVHTNSGVNNKAAYLMVEGGTFNGKTIVGLGIPKASRIYYEVQTNLLSSGSDYADLYDALYQGCNNLIGSFSISAGDCQQVRNVTDATAMNQQPVANPNYNPDAPLCPAGQIVENTYFFDDLESGTGKWAFTNAGTADGWGLDSPYYPVAHSGVHYLYASDIDGISGFSGVSDDRATMTANVHLPANAYLHFAHFYAFEFYNASNYDGGVVEYSINGGDWTGAGGLFQINGYNGVITPLFDNPLKGSSAFVRESRVYTSSRLSLASLAGQDVKFRWRMALDGSGSDLGWYLDDVRIYTCISTTAAPPRNYFTVANPTLTWNRVSDATQYEIAISQSSTFATVVYPNVIVPADQISVITDALTEGTYYWRVRAIRNGVPGLWSAFDSFVVDLP